MAQRCGFCGKTERQHKGKACFDMEGFRSIMKRDSFKQVTITFEVHESYPIEMLEDDLKYIKEDLEQPPYENVKVTME